MSINKSIKVKVLRLLNITRPGMKCVRIKEITRKCSHVHMQVTHSCRVSTPFSLYCSSCFIWVSSRFNLESWKQFFLKIQAAINYLSNSHPSYSLAFNCMNHPLSTTLRKLPCLDEKVSFGYSMVLFLWTHSNSGYLQQDLHKIKPATIPA